MEIDLFFSFFLETKYPQTHYTCLIIIKSYIIIYSIYYLSCNVDYVYIYDYSLKILTEDILWNIKAK